METLAIWNKKQYTGPLEFVFILKDWKFNSSRLHYFLQRFRWQRPHYTFSDIIKNHFQCQWPNTRYNLPWQPSETVCFSQITQRGWTLLLSKIVKWMKIAKLQKTNTSKVLWSFTLLTGIHLQGKEKVGKSFLLDCRKFDEASYILDCQKCHDSRGKSLLFYLYWYNSFFANNSLSFQTHCVFDKKMRNLIKTLYSTAIKSLFMRWFRYVGVGVFFYYTIGNALSFTAIFRTQNSLFDLL